MNGEPMAISIAENIPNGTLKEGRGGVVPSKKRKRRSRGSKTNGTASRRRWSVSKPARDPRDEASSLGTEPEAVGTRSPSPVIDFDGLSRPSKIPNFL
jgi:GTP cyclohydrolase I